VGHLRGEKWVINGRKQFITNGYTLVADASSSMIASGGSSGSAAQDQRNPTLDFNQISCKNIILRCKIRMYDNVRYWARPTIAGPLTDKQRG